MRIVWVKLTFLLLLLSISGGVFSQTNELVLRANDFDDNGIANIGKSEHWWFHLGNNPDWAANGLDVSEWEERPPLKLNNSLANEAGVIEGWFRIKIRIDSSVNISPIRFTIKNFGQAIEVYINGELQHTLGQMEPFKRSKYSDLYPGVSLPLDKDSINTVALHYLHHPVSFPASIFTNKQTLLFDVKMLRGHTPLTTIEQSDKEYAVIIFSLASIITILFLFLLLLLINTRQLLYYLLPICIGCFLLIILSNYYQRTGSDPSFEELTIWTAIGSIGFALLTAVLPLLFGIIFTKKIPSRAWWSIPFFVLCAAEFAYIKFEPLGITLLLISIAMCIYYITQAWRNLKGAQWAIIWGGIIFLVIVIVVFVGLSIDRGAFFKEDYIPLITLTFPLALLVYVVLRFREIQNERQAQADEVLKVTEEKRLQALHQKEALEIQVKERTKELEASLDSLKTTQNQLIQAEKMASLGELTAGIAHEIQNPLNFVNNFSDVSSEMIDEAFEELKSAADFGSRGQDIHEENGIIIKKENLDECKNILTDLKGNLEKISHHGNRASSIVKGMLDHSRVDTGEKVSTDINALCDEYLRLSYHGLRAKDKSFNCAYETHFDDSLPLIDVVPQDIGRVLLNIINNAFYSVSSKASVMQGASYKPLVTISTKKLNNATTITIKDNGTGMSQETIEKVFQPFFTTKPTGQGTGLGLSISYDIITKGHGGELIVDSTENEGTTFKIVLP